MIEGTKYQCLELRKQKKQIHSVDKNSYFEIVALFHHLYGEEKSAAISKLEFFGLNGVVLIRIVLAKVSEPLKPKPCPKASETLLKVLKSPYFILLERF